MKTIIIALISLTIFCGCSVNPDTGLVSASNYSSAKITIKIGNKTVCSSLSSGGKNDFYFTDTIGDNINCSEAEEIYIADYYDEVKGSIHYSKTTKVKLEKGFKYEIEVISYAVPSEYEYSYSNGYIVLYVNEGYQVGKDMSDSNSISYPGK